MENRVSHNPIVIDRKSEYHRVHMHLTRARKKGLPATLTIDEWIATIQLFGGLCAYCQKTPFEGMDHLVPLSALNASLRCGTTAMNCVPTCQPCNSAKSHRIGDEVPLSEPLELVVKRIHSTLRIDNAITVINAGPKTDREAYTVLGKYLDDALTLANMSQAELARRSGMKRPMVNKALKGKTVGRDILLQWCDILQCPEWLEERILNTAGYASRQQERLANNEQAAEEAHQRVLEELKQKEDN